MASCEKCDGKCCKYITIDRLAPKDPEDWDEIKWMLMHEGVIVYKDDEGQWCVEVLTKCKNLGEGNNCLVYDKRPLVCRDHGTDECEEEDDDFAEVLFTKPEDVDEYLKK